MGDVTVGAQPGKDGPEHSEEPSDRLPDGQQQPGPATGGEQAHPAPEGGDTGDGADRPVTEASSDGRRERGRHAAGRTADGQGETQRKQRSFWKELPLLIGIALLLALFFKTFLVQAFSIPSDSMQNTLQRGDRVLVDKLTPWFGAEPKRGEVVVFHDPGGWLGQPSTDEQSGIGGAVRKVLSFVGLMPSATENDLIKRVIAVGGDTVECERNGVVRVNGRPLDESDYLYPGNTPCSDNPFGPIKVPEGRIWVMGDHRQASLDSRYHQELPGGGTVSTDEVVGRAIVIAWPPNRWAGLPVPDTFDQPGLAGAAVAGTPALLGVAGAVPLVVWRRRRRRARFGGGAPERRAG